MHGDRRRCAVLQCQHVAAILADRNTSEIPRLQSVAASATTRDSETETDRGTGATAAQGVFGKAMPIGKNRGHVLTLEDAQRRRSPCIPPTCCGYSTWTRNVNTKSSSPI